MKWQPSDFNSPFRKWIPPERIFPCSDRELDALHALKKRFDPLPPYKDMETQAAAENRCIGIDGLPVSDAIAFLENTAEQCTSPETKHSKEGMQSARHWVQRVDTPDGIFRRLMDGYGISLMFGERCHQYIRNSNNWRGISGVLLDIDVFRDDKHPDAPAPCFSLSELLHNYPLLAELCSFILPSASSLYEGRPFKARGVLFFESPLTDQRVYRAFGDILCGELDCIPPNVTKNPVAVGFGNTHNAPEAWRNLAPDSDWIQSAIEQAQRTVLSQTKKRKQEQKAKVELSEHYRKQRTNDRNAGENISAFIEQCDPVVEMVRARLLTPGRGNEYRWHESEHERSCDIVDGSIHIFSHSMQAASPHQNINEAVGAHRFYLYQLSGLDMTKDSDKSKCRDFLFQRGYGSDPKAYAKKQRAKGIRKPVKLKKSNLACVLEVLEKTAKRIAEAFRSGKRFIGLRADTGTGKTEQAILYFLKGFAGFFSTPTTELAKDIFSRFVKAGINAFRWRGLGSEPDGQFPHEKPCMFPKEYQALAESGRNAYKLLCEPCPYLTDCEADGFRSQEEKAKQADVVVAAHPDLLNNPAFRRVAIQLLPGRKDDLVVFDEFDPLRFVEITIPKARLEYLRDTWQGGALGNLAIDILRTAADPKTLYKTLREMIAYINASGVRNDIISALGSLRIGDVIMDADAAHDYEIRTRQPLDVESIKKRPKLEPEDWNLLVQLEVFFDVYRHAETAPIFWKDDKLIFYVPPLPLPLKSKVILMSATLIEEFFRQVFSARQEKRGDVDFIDAADTEWHPGAKVFQLRTNRNPRRTLLEGQQDDNGKWKYTGELSNTGQDYLKMITDCINNNGDVKHSLIGHKAVIDNHTGGLQEAGVVCEHFGNLVGLDTKFKGLNVLQILGTPNVGSEDVQTHAKMLYGMTEAPLDFTRNADGSYADANVQKVADALVKSELVQAFGRGRPVRNPAIIVLWTSLELPSITHRPQTFLFDEVDFQQAEGNLDKLAAMIAKREAQEAAEAEAVEKGDIEGVMKATGVSRRTAERRTKETRTRDYAEEKQLAYQWYNEGIHPEEIAKRLSEGRPKPLHRTTIKRWMDEFQF